jgi:hypothetical protein
MGDTLADAVIFSIVPRFLVPSKQVGASRSIFQRFGIRCSARR